MLFAVLQLFFRVRELLLVFLDRFLPVGELLPRVRQLCLRLALRVGQRFFAVLIGLLRVGKLLLGVGKLLPGIVQLLLLLVECFARVGQRLRGLVMESAAARVGRAFGKLRDPGLRLVYAGGILVGIDLALPVSQPQIERRLIIQRKRLRQDVHE